MGKVKVVANVALSEEGNNIAKGQEFETTAERAKALGSNVSPVKKAETETEEVDEDKGERASKQPPNNRAAKPKSNR
mgnify:CR=1 FL=1